VYYQGRLGSLGQEIRVDLGYQRPLLDISSDFTLLNRQIASSFLKLHPLFMGCKQFDSTLEIPFSFDDF
jgi:hypothetical protein